MMPAPNPKTSAWSYYRQMFSWRMLIALAMGFSSGLPLMLTGTVLQAWMSDVGVDLKTIGLFALVGLPYTLKFLWAPLLDRFTFPLLGRRRGWLVIVQLVLIGTIVLLGASDPLHDPGLTALAALLLTFCSATQDSVIDAYRRETLAENEQGFGASAYTWGYRGGMVVATGGGLILADIVSFPTVFLAMAGIMSIGVVTTLLSPEPRRPDGTPSTLREAVILPFADFFRRQDAWLILAFIVLFKVGDAVAASLSTAFYLDTGFSNTEIGAVAKVLGVWAILVGVAIGGLLYLRAGPYRTLWICGILQALSTASFVIIVMAGHSLTALAGVIAFENVTAGMGTAALVAFMAHLTNKKFTATQYALLTSLSGVPRVILSAPAGYLAEWLGWFDFFVFGAFLAIPGLLLLFRFRSWLVPHEAEAPA